MGGARALPRRLDGGLGAAGEGERHRRQPHHRTDGRRLWVGRARVCVAGPFETLEKARGIAHSVILEKRGYWLAPGHNSVITDAAGQDWLVYHAA